MTDDNRCDGGGTIPVQALLEVFLTGIAECGDAVHGNGYVYGTVVWTVDQGGCGNGTSTCRYSGTTSGFFQMNSLDNVVAIPQYTYSRGGTGSFVPDGVAGVPKMTLKIPCP